MDPICSICGEPFFGGLCVWCTCDECGDNIRDGVCLNCNSHTCDQNSFNNSSNIPDFYTPPPPSFYCYNCGNPFEEGMLCGRCFCNQCGYTNCLCYAPSADTSFDCNLSFNNYPQNDFYEQNSYYNGDSFQNTSSFENCGGSFENSYYEPNSCYDSHGFNQPPQTSEFINQIFEIKSMMDELKEMVNNRYTHTTEPQVKSMEELLAEERKSKFCECCMYDDDDDSTITINLNPQNHSISSLVEPVDSIIMGDEPLNTIPATESDEFNKSSVENLVPIQSESGENSNGDSSFHPSFTPVEGSDVVLDEIEAFLANDSIPIMDDSNFDPEGDIRLLEELLNEEPSTSLPPMSNEDLVEVESYTNSHNEYTTSDEDSCGDIDDYDEDDDDLVPMVSETFDKTFTNPLFDFESDFNQISNNPIFDIPSDESEMKPEVQDSHDMIDSPHEKFSDELSHTISQPDLENDENGLRRNVLNEELHYDDLPSDADSFLFDLPSSRPPAKPPDEDFESGLNKDIFRMVDEVSELEFVYTIRVFQPYYTYPTISSFHSTGSEDTIFDPGISIAKWPFYLLSPRTN